MGLGNAEKTPQIKIKGPHIYSMYIRTSNMSVYQIAPLSLSLCLIKYNRSERLNFSGGGGGCVKFYKNVLILF